MFSVCMIVKNEERWINQALSNIKALAQEIIVIDTGSTDKTMLLAKKLGAKIIRYRFNNDFSKIRNIAISNASSKWILFIDADEKILASDIKKIKRLIQEDSKDGYWIQRYNYLGTGGWRLSYMVRLFRKNKNIFYEGKIWEKVRIPNFEQRVAFTDISIHHYGECRNISRLNRRLNLYLKLAKEEELINKNPFLYSLEADRYLFQDKPLKALERCQECLRQYPDYIWIYLNLGAIYRRLGKSDKAYSYYKKGIELCSKNKPKNLPFFFNQLGIMHYLNNQIEESIKCFKEGLSNNRDVCHLHLNLGLAYEKRGDFSQAVNSYCKALKINRNLNYEHLDFGRQLHRRNRYRTDVIPQYKGVFNHLGYCSDKLGDKKKAKEFYEKAKKVLKRNF